MASSVNGKPIGYETGPTPAQGAVTVELQLSIPGMPLQGLIDQQYLDSKIMDKRPGMYLKYLPFRYDELTGKLLSGGSYLFDTWDNAKQYARWVGEEYEVGEPKTKFLKQPLFEKSVCRVWRVIGAHSFAPIEQHAIGQLQYWSCQGEDAESVLRDQYENLKKAAEEQGAVALCLLFNPEEKMAGFQLAFRKETGSDEACARAALAAAAAKPSLASLLPAGVLGKPLFDRTSLLVTIWLPRSRAAGGCELLIPNHPVVPDITHKHL